MKDRREWGMPILQEAARRFSSLNFYTFSVAAFAKLYRFTVSPLVSSINILETTFCLFFFLFFSFLLYIDLALISLKLILQSGTRILLCPLLIRCVIAKPHHVADAARYIILRIIVIDINQPDLRILQPHRIRMILNRGVFRFASNQITIAINVFYY